MVNAYRDKEVVGVFVRFRAPLQGITFSIFVLQLLRLLFGQNLILAF
jgi:hypothetical protein